MESGMASGHAESKAAAYLILNLAAATVLLLFGPQMLREMKWLSQPSGPLVFHDFLQEWASARFYRDGLSLYTDQEVALRRYLGVERDRGQPVFNQYTAHPPGAVLLALPLSWLSYERAFTVWDGALLSCLLLAIGLVGWHLRWRASVGKALPLAALLVLYAPLRQDLVQGQLNSFLLLLTVCAWVAGRRGRDCAAGMWLGVASSVKLFPVFLILPFLVQRRWKVLVGWAAACAIGLGVTLAVFGLADHLTYVGDVLPHVREYRSSWVNASFYGFWSRLLDPGARGANVQPIQVHPSLALATTVAACVLVSLLLAISVRRYAGASDDLALAASVPAMLLVSPITWDHYFVLLLLSFWIWWHYAPGWVKPGLIVAYILVSLPIGWWWQLLLGVPVTTPGGQLAWVKHRATFGELVTGIAVPHYLLLGWFVLGLTMLAVGKRRMPPT
ncbi:MAG: hypothetical protein C4297_09390 [Gemmataceae bacterium]